MVMLYNFGQLILIYLTYKLRPLILHLFMVCILIIIISTLIRSIFQSSSSTLSLFIFLVNCASFICICSRSKYRHVKIISVLEMIWRWNKFMFSKSMLKMLLSFLLRIIIVWLFFFSRPPGLCCCEAIRRWSSAAKNSTN